MLQHPAYQRPSLEQLFRRPKSQGNLVLEDASRLDAFSGYQFRAWLPSDASGETTGTPAARPSRSSRTKDSAPQVSYAHSR